jgi:tRNA pseudouridine55 synthase
MEQIPPHYSAVHFNGQRAYKLARQGAEPALKAKKITVYAFDIINYRKPDLLCSIKCSKGTYIRALARDLGTAADSCAYVEKLSRTSVGKFLLAEALDPDQIDHTYQSPGADWIVTNLTGIERLTVKDAFLLRILTGYPPEDAFFMENRIDDGNYFVLDSKNIIRAVITRSGKHYKYQSVLGGK